MFTVIQTLNFSAFPWHQKCTKSYFHKEEHTGHYWGLLSFWGWPMAMGGTIWQFIQCLNFAQKQFNSIRIFRCCFYFFSQSWKCHKLNKFLLPYPQVWIVAWIYGQSWQMLWPMGGKETGALLMHPPVVTLNLANWLQWHIIHPLSPQNHTCATCKQETF